MHEANNLEATKAFAAVESYLDRTKIPGLTLANVTRVTLDSAQKYLTVDDGNRTTYQNIKFKI